MAKSRGTYMDGSGFAAAFKLAPDGVEDGKPKFKLDTTQCFAIATDPGDAEGIKSTSMPAYNKSDATMSIQTTSKGYGVGSTLD